MNEDVERMRLQLTERDAKNLSMTGEIDRLNGRIEKKNRGLEEAVIMTDNFSKWVEMYIASPDNAKDSMVSNKRLEIAKLSTYFKEALHG